MQTILPISLKVIPIQRLFLINFERKADTYYNALELQYFQGAPYGEGFRILAYRNDAYVDIYDDLALHPQEQEEISVTGKGLASYQQTAINDVKFDVSNGNLQLTFSFQDKYQRLISLNLIENSTKASESFALLAPVGAGSLRPTAFPLYYLYDFDFVRQKDTHLDLQIAGQKMTVDPFPVPIPIGGQKRYMTRYSLESQIVDFLPIVNQVKLVDLDEQLAYCEGLVKYQFQQEDGDLALAEIQLQLPKPITIEFVLPMTLKTQAGSILVKGLPEMGSLQGKYLVTESPETLLLVLNFSGGWQSQPKTLVSKLILGRNSNFAKWPKQYRYQAEINRKSLQQNAQWVNLQ